MTLAAATVARGRHRQVNPPNPLPLGLGPDRAAQGEGGRAGRLAGHDLDVAPRHQADQAGSERLEQRLASREPGRQVLVAAAPGSAPRRLGGRKQAVDEAGIVPGGDP